MTIFLLYWKVLDIFLNLFLIWPIILPEGNRLKDQAAQKANSHGDEVVWPGKHFQCATCHSSSLRG